MVTRESSRKNTRSTQEKSDLVGDKKDCSNDVMEQNSDPNVVKKMAPGSQWLCTRVCNSSQRGSKCLVNPCGDEKEDKIMCICGEDSEFGEMASCEICAGWFHFQCLGFKENVALLDDRSFVCCFCMASKTVSLMREVEHLRTEMQVLREKLAEREESDLDEKNTQKGGEAIHPSEVTAHQSEASFSKVVKRKKKPRKASTPTSQTLQPQEKTRSSNLERREKCKAGKQTVEVKGRQLNQPKERSSRSMAEKKFVGRRKLWGTKRVTTEEEVKDYLVSRVPEVEPLEVSRVFNSEEGRYRWWFWLVVDESVLKLVDEETLNIGRSRGSHLF